MTQHLSEERCGKYAHTRDFAIQYIEGICTVLHELEIEPLLSAIRSLELAYMERRQVFLAGNGGSAATASHMASDLVGVLSKRGGVGFRARSLSDNASILTSIANDEEYAEVFARQIAVLAQPRDVLIAISASGNSPNIIRAIQEANRVGLTTIGILGMGGGKAAKLVDTAVLVPSNEYGPVEDVHMLFDHLITAYFQNWPPDQA